MSLSPTTLAFASLAALATVPAAGADDPAQLAKDFVRLAETLDELGGSADLEGYRARQKKAIPLYLEFLGKHPESVYTSTVRWSLHTAYQTIEWSDESARVLDELQDGALQELLKVAFAQRAIGNTKGSSQLVEGILATCEDGGIRARAAQYLSMIGETGKANEILDEVARGARHPDRVRGRALLIKSELHRLARQDGRPSPEEIAILRELARRFPETPAGAEGRRKLAAAELSVGSDALPFSAETVAGETVSLASFKGRAVLLYFFATWSYPSWRDLAALKSAVARLPAGSLAVVGAACDSYIDRPKRLFAAHDIAWPLVAEGNKWLNSLAQVYDVTTVPCYILIDANGKIAARGVMRVTDLEPLLAKVALK